MIWKQATVFLFWKQATVFLFLCAIWGSSWLAAGTLAGLVPPLEAGAGRFLLAALLLLPWILFKRAKIPWRHALKPTLILSITLIVLPFVTLVWAAQRVSPGTIAIIFAASPLLIVLLMSRAGASPVPRAALQATICGLGGIALGISGAASLASISACAVLLLVVTSGSFSLVYAKKALRSMDPTVTAALQLAVAAGILELLSLLFERGQPAQWTHAAFESLLYLGMLSGAFGFSAYFWLLHRLEPFQLATVQWIEPLVAIAESAVLLHQTLTWSLIAAALIVLGSCAVVLRAQPGDDDPLSLRVTE